MNNVFVKTENVKKFMAVAEDLKEVKAGVPGMGLVYGKRGLGKTRAALWYATQNNDVYLRAKRMWTPTWLMEELSIELMLAQAPSFRTMFREVAAALTAEPRLVIIDETDLMAAEVLETVRDIHDITGTPIILIGMDKVRDRLQRFAALYDRLLHKEEFQGLGDADIRQASEQLFGLKADAGVVAWVREATQGNFRKSIIVLAGLERKTRANGSKSITMAEVRACQATA